jgi:fluoroacetyl-CoA thioesterase
VSGSSIRLGDRPPRCSQQAWSRCAATKPGRRRRGFVSYPAMLLNPGLSARVSLVVGAGDTAPAMRSGTVEVLGTPRLIALCEEAAGLALADSLPHTHTTVGVRIQFDHLAPVRPGSELTAEAVLERVEGRRLVFTISASDSSGLVGAGRLTRVLVETEAFLAKAR